MNNIVQPVTTEQTTTADPVYRALRVSGTRKGSRYNLSKGDRERGFYFLYNGLEVPFKALFNMNAKTDGILGITFGTAKDCPSRSLGLCQLPNDSLCYARSGEARATRKNNEDGAKGMDSYYNGLLCSAFWDAYETDTNGDIRQSFEDYLIYNEVETLRFNLKGDFRHSLDCSAIWHLAEHGFSLTGYTARDDLAELLHKLAEHPNIILNGSNQMYTNRFKATASIREFLKAEHPCLGNCSACKNCYRLRGKEITVLIHGRGSETALNTADNVETIRDIFYTMGIETTEEDFETAQGLITCINHIFKTLDENFEGFKTTKDFLNWSERPRFILSNFFGGYYTADNVEAERGIFSAPTLEELKNLIIGSHGDLNKFIYVLGDL